MKKISWIFLFVLTHIGAQSIPIGAWRSHYSFTKGRLIERANETLFCATENGLFSIDVNTKVSTVFGKEMGLGDARITALHFDESEQVLLVGYESGIVDLIHSDGEINSLTTIRDAPIVAPKDIRSITSNQGKAYLATGFGVVYLDLINEAIIESYRNIGEGGLQLSVHEVETTQDSLYIVTENGIQAGSYTDNLLDFNDWTRYPETGSLAYRHLTEFEDRLYVVADGTDIWEFNGSSWFSTGLVTSASVNALFSGDLLYAVSDDKVFSVGNSINEVVGTGNFSGGNDLVQVENGFWIASSNDGLIESDSDFSIMIPKGPQDDYPSNMRWVNGKTYLMYGPDGSDYDGSFDELGYSEFRNGAWTQVNLTGFSNITDVGSIGSDVYFSSMGNGLYSVPNQEVIDDSNSSLGLSDGFSTVDLTGLISFGNSLWIIAYNTENSLYQMEGGELVPINESIVGTKYPVDIEVSELGVLWVRKGDFEGGGISAFFPETSEQRTFGTASGLPSSQTTGFMIDTEDRAWISTINGISTYDGASFPFNSFNISIPIYENQLLFENERINDVLTDGGDRIWVATEQNGVWVLAPDLSEVVYQFTAENSPLPSNSIRSFAYDESSGEVFISTQKGVVSFRSASSRGQTFHEKSMKVFPNPVDASFDGQVGFSGLVKNATLKITDVKGRLIQEVSANGSTAGWDLRTFSGRRVEAGVYLVFSSSSDGQETLVGKIAVLK